MSPARFFLLFVSLVASVSALAAPHNVRSAHHRALAGRVPIPAPVDAPVLPLRRRQNSKRCKPRISSTLVDAQATTSHAPEATKAAPKPEPPKVTTHAAVVVHPKPAPEPTKPAPRPTATKAEQHAPPANTKPSSNLPSFMVGSQSGQGTFYATGLGACGITNQDTDYIAAVSHLLFDNFPGYSGGNPNKNPICGRKVTANYQGKSVTVTITDRCEACAVTDLDFSPSAFNHLADFSVGRISHMSWSWN